MNDESGYVTLKGVDLRVVVLEATGWTCRQEDWDGLKTYGVFDPNGVKFGSTHYATPKQAWQYAPPVESSVDAAFKWLTLPDTFGWQWHSSPVDETQQRSWSVTLVDYQTRQRWSGLGVNLAAVICDVYLRCKGGA